ncbi:SigE family RNA polymerase sigma factor [Kribbella deserti]|uniref:SigE family RNA polymerase sigma factor n=1 Tax=Kribbella deserti TaxID=1926257 RepID=A0ABV6QIA9_9ACTN
MTFEDWARTELPGLLRFATALCGSRHLAEEISQDMLINAHRRWDHIQQTDRPDAYLRRMLVNEFLSWRRKWSRFVPKPEIWIAETNADHAETVTARDELISQLGRLPRRQRAVLALRYYGGLNDAEIAETLRCSTSTVRAHASRALATLRVELTATTSTTDQRRTAQTGANHAY